MLSATGFMQMRSLLAVTTTAALRVTSALAGHGLDNNWNVSITGEKDSSDCFRFASGGDIEDLGMMSIPHVYTDSQEVTCVTGTETCTENYDCDAVAAKKSSLTFQGCTFEESTAMQVTVSGFIMDGTCYNNFIVEQKNFNGAPGLTPDQVYVRTESELHTRACLLVSYCSSSGFHLVERAAAGSAYEQVVALDAASTALIFDWLVTARHSCAAPTPAPTPAPEPEASGAPGAGRVAALLLAGSALAAARAA